MTHDLVQILVRKEVADLITSRCKEAKEDISEYILRLTLYDKLLDELLENIDTNYASERTKWIHYAGGDWYIKDELIKMLSLAPPEKCTLVEVFGGSGVVSQYAQRDKFVNIVYNDAESRIYNLVKVVKERREELRRHLALLPYSREVRELILRALKKNEEFDDIVLAVMVFYYISSTFAGKVRGGFGYGKESRRGANEAVSFASRIEKIKETSIRFRDVVIDCCDFQDIIEKYDSPTTVFYCDPPYVGRDDYYWMSFTSVQATKLAKILNEIEGYYLLKIAEDQEIYYKLNYKSRIVVEKPLNMKKTTDAERERYNHVFLMNYEVNEKTEKLSGKTNSYSTRQVKLNI